MNLPSLMTKIIVKEQEQPMHVSQRLKMYEYVGMADNYHRRKVMKCRLLHITKEQRTMISQSSKITKHEGTKTKDYSTTTHNGQQQRTKKT